MSDLMLFGVLRMPYELTMKSELSRRQFYSRAQEAADRIERLERELDQARGAYQGCATALEIANRAAEAERKPVSIGDDEHFHALVIDIMVAAKTATPILKQAEKLETLIAYIDGRTAGTAPPACRNQGGICSCRSGGSFGGCAIERAAAPSPLPSKEETK